MTQKFLAAFFPGDRQDRLRPGLVEALARLGCTERRGTTGIRLFASDDLPLRRLAQGAGFVVGPLFQACGAPAAARLDADLSTRGATAIIGRFWGSYVAIARDEEQLRVLRDPSGGLACYHVAVEGAHYVTSIPHLLVDCGLIPAEIDWSLVAISLMRRRARLSATALRHISEVLPATLLTCGQEGVDARLAWDPWRYATCPLPGDPEERLEQALTSTLKAWMHCTKHPLVEVSGGLDSAIVAAGIAAAAPRASLITFAAAPGDPDETAYAGAVAEHLGLDLEIGVPAVEDVDLTRSLAADLPRPNARAFTQTTDALSLRHARAIGADAFVSGGGGDDVFCYLRTILPALDRLGAEGWGAMARTAHDIAVMNHSTLWEALLRIARRLLRGRSAKAPADLRLLARTLALEKPVAEPAPPAPGAPGKADHIRGILTIHNYLDGHARAHFAPIISPLLSQPVVECCLSIPTWQWCHEGRNRAVARRAFRNRLPEIVIERRSKGAFDGFCGRILQANQHVARTMLLEGRLAGEGLLDRQAVDAALRHPSPPADMIARLLALVDVESWIQSWASRQPSVR